MPHLIYVAILSQEGANDPEAIVRENTLSGTPEWERKAPGEYTATLAGAFLANKTFLLITHSRNSGRAVFLRNNSNVLSLDILDGLGDPIDDGFNQLYVEVRVYE